MTLIFIGVRLGKVPFRRMETMEVKSQPYPEEWRRIPGILVETSGISSTSPPLPKSAVG